VETIVAPNIDVVRRGVLIGFTTKLDSKSSGILEGRNINQSLALLVATTIVVSILHMVFTNPIMATHGNRTANRPLMSSMDVGRCKNANVMHSRGGYRMPIVVTTPIFYHKNGHYVRPNKVALKYLDFKKKLIQMLMLECSIL
jgi:hypothetical protein